MANEDELRASRLRHVEALQAAGVQPFSSLRLDDAAHAARMRFVALAQDETARQALPSEDEIGVDDPHYPLFGRVVARRGPFVVLRTPMGDAQALVRQDSLPAAAQAVWQQLDLGDHLWVSGPAMRTRTGAAALRCEALQHMSKALLPPPAKWHGLRDVEKRYRERYVDLFANPEVSHVFRARAAIVQALRAFLDAHAFVEVETPLLHHVRGGATARPFGTHHNALDLALYLRIAPELHLKRLLVGGLERVYELGRAFRNEGVSTRHNPEFTILEYYQAYADIELLQTQTVAMLRAAAAAVDAVHPPFAAARTVALEEDWVQVRMRESVATALRRASDLPPDAIRLPIEPEAVHDAGRLDAALQAAEGAGQVPPALAAALARQPAYGPRVYALFEHLVEPHLETLYRSGDGARSLPVFIREFPVEVSPLARARDADPAWVDRFELFVEGRELANAFNELGDPDEQSARFRAQLAARQAGDEEAMDFDGDFVRALSYGMPPAAGFGLGVDRLTMVLCGLASIRDVLLFPLLRPEVS